MKVNVAIVEDDKNYNQRRCCSVHLWYGCEQTYQGGR
mgnify:CR=1 FL=1